MEQKQYDNTNRGAVWDNANNKRPDKQDPDLSGELNVDGKVYKISMWTNQRKGDNQPKFDISVRPATANTQQPSQSAQASTGIPF